MPKYVLKFELANTLEVEKIKRENSAKQPDWKAFEKYTEQIMEQDHIAGASVAVSRNNQIIYAKGFGVSDISSKEPVDPNTIFGIASVSKSFTAMAIMQLQDKKLLNVDDPVTKYIPELKLHGAKDMAKIKIRHLLSHTTGIPPVTRRQDLIKFSEHLDFLENEDYELLGCPGEYLSYCNDSFLLLGLIIERLTGKLYTRHMTAEFLDTLEMNRSTYSLEDLAKFDNVSVPYVFNHKSNSLEQVQWPKLGNYEVGGGIRSNALDLMKYAQVYIEQGTYKGRTIVSAQALSQMRLHVYKVARNSYYGFALKSTPDYFGVTLVEHSGGQPGVSSNFGFVPEENLAAAVLTNVSDVRAGDIWLGAINAVLGTTLDTKRSYEPRYYLSQERMKDFVGIYKTNEGGKLVVFEGEGCLKIEVADKEYVLSPSSESTLVYEVEGSQQVIKFLFDKTNKPWAAFSGLRVLRRTSD